MDEDKFVFFYKRPFKNFKDIVSNQDLEDLLIKVHTIDPEEKNSNTCTTEFVNTSLDNHKHTVLKQNIKSEFVRQSDDGRKKITKIKNNNQKLSKRRIQTPKSIERNDSSDIRDDTISFEEILYRNENFITQFTKTGHKNTILDESILNVLQKFERDNSPLNRFSWKILQKLNISSHKFYQQYIKIEGRDILLSGNIGGNIRDVIFKTTTKLPTKIEIKSQKSPKIRYERKHNKKGLLTFMNYKLKPGPLCKKSKLNNTELNAGLGKVELVKLPSVVLEVSPLIGSPLDARLCTHLKRVRNSEGFIDAPWAKFASSTVDNKSSKTKNFSHKFIIPYANNQPRVLMRRDYDVPDYSRKGSVIKDCKSHCHTSVFDLDTELEFLDTYIPKNSYEKSVKCVLSDMIKTVSIGEVEDSISKYDPTSDIPKIQENLFISNSVDKKRGIKRKYVNELKKLNVTVIDIGGDKMKKNCSNDYCKFGCVCDSLSSNYCFNEHCGSPECMFECKCILDEKSNIEICSPENSLKISQSTVLNLQQQINRNLSKEEKKFHRTVIRSNDQTVLLGAKRRGVKMPKRFEDYNTFSEEKHASPKEYQLYSEVKVLLPKLPSFVNGQPWCMVHQIYKCFCKGLLVDGSRFDFSTYLDDDECQNTIDKSLSLQKNIDIKVVIDVPCSRTTYNPELLERITKKKFAYITRNIDIILAENKIEHADIDVSQVCNYNKSNNSNEKEGSNVCLNKENQNECELRGLVSNNVANLLNNKNLIIPPKKDMAHIMSLNSLVSNMFLKNNYVWLTVRFPYYQFITIENRISCPYICVNILQASNDLIQKHQPYVNKIIMYNSAEDCDFLLRGESFGWQILGECEYHGKIKNENFDVCNTQPKIVSVQSISQPIGNVLSNSNKSPNVQQDSSTPKFKKINTPKIDARNKFVPTISANNVKNSKYWLLLMIGEDFREINIKSKHFLTSLTSIHLAIVEACKSKEFIRIPSKQVLDDSDSVHFGVYAAPCKNRKCVFLGPYGFNDSVNIEVTAHNSSPLQSFVNWLCPTNLQLYDILNTLSKQMFAKYVSGAILRTKISKKMCDSNDIQALIEMSIRDTKFFVQLIDVIPNTTFKNSFMRTARNRSISKSKLTESPKKSNNTSVDDMEVDLQKSSYIQNFDDDVIILPNYEEVFEISDSE